MVPFGLSEAEKDALILEQQTTITELRATVSSLQARIVELEEIVRQLRVKLDSTNSNRPPSSDGLSKKPPKPRSLRQKSGKKPGGQPGHPGKSLAWSTPDEIVEHRPEPTCDACNAPLPEATVSCSRQVVDLPPIRHRVTEHRVLEAHCSCGKVCTGSFPENVRAPLQYGPQIRALAVYLTQHQMLPIQRSANLISDLFEVSFSERSVEAACIQAACVLEPTVDAIAASLRNAKVVHADETGIRIEKALHWLHTAVTRTLSWIGVHKKRGEIAIVALGVLPNFRGTLIHDGWKSYRKITCIHSLCNAHHLRELDALAKDHHQPWAAKMGELLREADHAVNVSPESKLTPEEIADYRRRYGKILEQGDLAHPLVASSGKRGKTKQSQAANLLRRLRTHADDVWRFASDPDVPFTNNLAEQSVRMPKVKQKISGSFRTKEGAQRFCIIRSYLETMRKQGQKLFGILVDALQGKVVQPNLS